MIIYFNFTFIKLSIIIFFKNINNKILKDSNNYIFNLLHYIQKIV
jgi:hypothetical protein